MFLGTIWENGVIAVTAVTPVIFPGKFNVLAGDST
jgi:hypothetical protein